MLNLFKRSSLKTINKEALDAEILSFNSTGVSGDDDGIVISLTSFPQRMYELHYALYSLLTQSVKPSKIVLWLSKEEFPNAEKDIPEKILALRKNGLSIEWVDKNLYSYTKLVPALNKYPNNVIVTVDDDIFYERNLIETLLDAHKSFPNDIICHRAHRISTVAEKILPYKRWNKKIKGNNVATFKNFLTGVGGVLYPQNCLYKDAVNKDLFTTLSPKNDDIWFWAMAVLNKTKILVPKNNIRELTYVNPQRERGLINEITLFASNKAGANDLQFKNVLNYYPQILELLKTN